MESSFEKKNFELLRELNSINLLPNSSDKTIIIHFVTLHGLLFEKVLLISYLLSGFRLVFFIAKTGNKTFILS